ncbi:MAG: hypothetical protein ACYC1Z_01895 [Georgenia sp.]
MIDSLTQPAGRGGPGNVRRRVAAARRVLSWPERELWARWQGPSAGTAAASRARGRTGEEVTDLDILPGEARVCRSMQLGPQEARGRREAGGGPLPDGAAVGWFGYGDRREDRHYGVVDPPGTRGRLAQQA